MSDPVDRQPPGMSTSEAEFLGQMAEYRLLEKLGEGGMGEVYKARQVELDRIVALKILPPGRTEDPQAIARFQREMKAVGRLDHPNVVRAYDAREIEGRRVLVMEYVDGLDLGELVERLGPLPVADGCELVRQAAEGLACAHEHGLVHRDVKPSNLILGRDAIVRVLDLGLALMCTSWPAEKEMTGPGQVMGTPDYMAPEQASDSHNVDARADLYSLGCTFYRLLAGRPPFSGRSYQTAFNKMNAHVNVPVPPIRQLRVDVPEPLAAVIERMLAKAPRERFATAKEVAEALGPFLAGNDLPRLLASCEAAPRPPKAESERIAGAHPLVTPPPTSLPRDRPTRPALPSPIPGNWVWMKWGLTLGLAALVVFMLVTLAIFIRAPRDDATTRGVQNPTAVERPSPSVPFTDRPRPQWLLLPWTPTFRSGKPGLCLFDPFGRPHPVTNDPSLVDSQPMLSPDRRRIVFLRSTTPASQNTVCVCDTDGGNLRELVRPIERSERFLSPVWVSDSRIYFTRDHKPDASRKMEIWRVDLDGSAPKSVFRFKDTLDREGGLVTDISPDGQRLVVIAQQQGDWSTADVYVTDLQGKLIETVWEDEEDDRHADARALWSPDGQRIVWHRNFTHDPFFQGSSDKPIRAGIALAERSNDRRWIVRFQPPADTVVTPVEWSDDGRLLLCARVHESHRGHSGATLFLMDLQLQPRRRLCEIEGHWGESTRWAFCRQGDWAVLPPDAPRPNPLGPVPGQHTNAPISRRPPPPLGDD